MKKQLKNLATGTKFFFANNQNLICVVTFNSGKTFRYKGLDSKKEIIYKKMPSICEGHLVTIVN